MKGLVVVADNSLIVEAIQLGLRQSGGFQVLGHFDGRTATVRPIVDAGPEVVLVDDMQHSDQAIALIRDINAEAKRIVVILLTVRMDQEWLDRAFDAGASGAISKSIHPVALGTLVRETADGNVIHLSSARRRDNRMAPADCPLTARELEILQLVAAGSTNGTIARRLWITEQTVKFHLSNVYRKLDVANRTEASHYAHVNGLMESGVPETGARSLALA